MLRIRKAALAVALVCAVLTCVGVALASPWIWKSAALASSIGFGIAMGGFSATKGFQYTMWIVVAFLAGMLFPQHFQQFKDYQWAGLLVVQLVMFGMRTQMKIQDFAGVLRVPWAVVVGLVCQFTIMPLVGFGLAKAFEFPAEIGAGIVLIGACSSGLASNVMAYLAKANLALSITLTSVATLFAPVMTPLWMKLLADEMVDVNFLSMMVTVVKIVIVPVGAALLHEYLRKASPQAEMVIHRVAAVTAGWLLILALGGWDWLSSQVEGNALLLGIVLPGYLFSTFLVGALYHRLALLLPSIDKAMPYVSMFGIFYFTLVATAAGQPSLLQVGFLLVLAAMLHNTAGYVLGYGLSRMLRLDPNDARTVAFEVGLQNGGMASGIALAMGKLGTVGLASAIFSPWMNVSGSILANIWRRSCSEVVPPRKGAPD